MRFVLPLALIGCAPLHVPQPAQTALLSGARDGHIRAQSGLQGTQVDVAFAPVDHVGVRAAGHGDVVFSNHGMATGGVGIFAHPGPVRLGAWADGGFGYGQGSYTTDIDLFTDTPPVTHVLEARLTQGSLTLEGGFDAGPVELGLAVRGNRTWAHHSKLSDGLGTSQVTTVEPAFHTRVGEGPVGFVGHTGLMIPVDVAGDVGVPVPVMVGAGVEFDFGRRRDG